MRQEKQSFNINGFILDQRLIRQAYQRAKQNKNTYEVLKTVFHTIELANQQLKQPGQHSKQIIQNINNAMGSREQPPKRQLFLTSKQTYPLNKNGSFGVLTRECTFTQKGISQKQAGKEPVQKIIVGLDKRIETEFTKNNEKLEWFKSIKQYPFRIILRDDKKAPKAIYFATRERALKVSSYFCCKFVYKGNFNKVVKQGFKIYKERIQQAFKQKLTFKTKSIQPIQQSQNGQFSDNMRSSEAKAEVEGGPVSAKLSKMKSKGYNPALIRQMIDKQLSRAQLDPHNTEYAFANFSLFRDLGKAYKTNLFCKWIDTAKKLKQQEQINHPQTKSKEVYNKFIAEKVPQILDSKKPSSFTYKSIEFLWEDTVMVKPIVIISLIKKGSVEYETKFSTFLVKKIPHLSYELIGMNGNQRHLLSANVHEYDLNIKAIDYLTNASICSTTIALKHKILSPLTFLTNHQKSIRLEIKFSNQLQSTQSQSVRHQSPEGSYLEIKPLSSETLEQVRAFWQSEGLRKNLSSVRKDIKLIDMLELYELAPKSWMLGLTQSEFKVISILNSASKILSFQLSSCILPLIKIVQKLYSDIEELVEVILSIITNYMRVYFFKSQLNQTNKLHLSIGLDGEIEYGPKIGLQMQLIKHMIRIESPDFFNHAESKNIGYVQFLYEQLYEIYSQNFLFQTLIEIWNFLFREPTMMPIYLVLISVWLVKFYEPKLWRCSTFKQVKQILLSKNICDSNNIFRQILILRQKFFTNNQLKLNDQTRGLFQVKPLEKVVIQFYQRETERLDLRKQKRIVEKTQVLHSLNKQLLIELPKYQSRRYCLHIYFYRLPSVTGTLYIRANNVEYECLNLPQNRYFIIEQVNTKIRLQFINNKSDEYVCDLDCIPGVDRCTVQLKSTKSQQIYQIEYLCGLLDQGHAEALKKNRKFQNFIGTFASQADIFGYFKRPVNQCMFLNTLGKKLKSEDLGRKIKVVFSQDSKYFDEIQFFLRWISVSSISLAQKMKLIEQLSCNLAEQCFLSPNQELQKKLLHIYLSISQFHISPQQFKSFYSQSLSSDLKSPKIFNCKLMLSNSRQLNVSHIVSNYISNKLQTHFHQDIIVNDLMNHIQKELETSLLNINEGYLVFTYSSFGEVKNVQVPMIKKKTSKDFMMDDTKFQLQSVDNNDISTAHPQLLVSEILPTFTKIGSILDYVNNSSRSINSLSRSRENQKVAESINLLKNCDLKYGKVLLMRYNEHPSDINIPFLNYYHQIVCEEISPVVPKDVYLNNLLSDIRTICTYPQKLKFTDNQKDPYLLDKRLGLHGNLRNLPPKIEKIFFFSMKEAEIAKFNAHFFMNYGFGVFRWEPCLVLAKAEIVKGKERKENQKVKTFLIKDKGTQRFCRDFEVKISQQVETNLPIFKAKSSSQNMNSPQKSKKSINLHK